MLDAAPYSKQQELNFIRAALETERQAMMPVWRDLGDFILPSRPRFNTTSPMTDRRSLKILDSTPSFAARTLGFGMNSGITSPARPWFSLETYDSDLNEYGPVKNWLDDTTKLMGKVFGQSNLYNAFPIMYYDMGTFATGSMLMEEDMESVVRFYPFAVGSYCISNNERLRVDTFTREFQLTVRQIVAKFGRKTPMGKLDLSSFSIGLQNAWEQKRYETKFTIRHFIRPNPDYDPSKPKAKYKRYESCYYEQGSTGQPNTNQEELYLRESGYDFFPVLCGRWEVNAEDSWGVNSPGFICLGDSKQLQKTETTGLQGIEKMVKPPMTGPSSMRQQKVSILPGDITYTDEMDGQKGFRTAHEVNLRLDLLEQKQAQVRNRIERSYFVDLFLAISRLEHGQVTAREIQERHEEKLLALGPVLEQLNQDVLDPLIDNTFNIMVRRKMLPPIPDEMRGMELKVNYVSIMHQAQKSLGVSGIERFVGFWTNTAKATGDASCLMKIDLEQAIDEHGEGLGIPAKMIRSDDQVAQMKADQAKAQQAAQQQQQVQTMAGAAKDLGSIDTSKPSALTDLLSKAQAGQLTPQVA